jgi:hypothetical protein
MGYRSEVAFAIQFPTPEQRTAFTVAIKLAADPAEVACLDEYTNYDDRTYTAQFTDVKWYPDYADVKAHHTLMERAVEDHGASYYFVRIGEEINDIEEQHCGDDVPWDVVCLHRSVSVSIK